MTTIDDTSKKQVMQNKSIKNNITHTHLKTLFKGSLMALVIAALIGGYYMYGVYYPGTDDAYVDSNLMDVSAKVGGFIENIYVEDNQFVKKGQVLLDINPEYYNIALNKAQNKELYSTSQLAASKKSIQVAEANLAKAENDFSLASELAKRYQDLYNSGSGSKQDMQTYATKVQAAHMEVKQRQALLDETSIQYKAALAQVDAATNDVQTAKISMNYTQVIAPVNGYITNLNLVKGQLVKAEDPIFGFIDNSKWWVDANFKETQLSRVKVGQKVRVKLDMYNHTYNGIVKSISYASGNTFALLPSENATGNWVKVTQRFTVRVQLENNNSAYPLRVGSSADVTIDTTKG